MKALNLLTLLLSILAGVDVGIMGLLNVNVITGLFGEATMVSRVVELILGLAALYQLFPFMQATMLGEIRAELSHHRQ
ncbi:MAG: DUF378 domain-containing protein [Caulobacteraceae bacterium]|nr:DUF378 domain-containing protein [Caulobacteraceae bacterium]